MTAEGSVETTIANKDGSFEREINVVVVMKIRDLIQQKMIKVRVDEEISN